MNELKRLAALLTAREWAFVSIGLFGCILIADGLLAKMSIVFVLGFVIAAAAFVFGAYHFVHRNDSDDDVE